MTERNPGLDLATRLTAHSAVDLDAKIWGQKNSDRVGGELAFRDGSSWTPLSEKCWPPKDEDTVHLGIRVTETIQAPLALATALVAMATERGITPVIFSHSDSSGLEQFGFRIEQVTGSSAQEKAKCEEELKRYYQMAIVVDSANLAAYR